MGSQEQRYALSVAFPERVRTDSAARGLTRVLTSATYIVGTSGRVVHAIYEHQRSVQGSKQRVFWGGTQRPNSRPT